MFGFNMPARCMSVIDFRVCWGDHMQGAYICQIIWAMIDREYCSPYCSSSPGGVLYIHNLYFTEKLFFPSFDSPSHLPHNLLLSPNELFQPAFQTVPPSFFLAVSSSYRISFSYRNPQHCWYLPLFSNRCSVTSFLFHLLVYLSPKRQTPPSVDSQTVLTP